MIQITARGEGTNTRSPRGWFHSLAWRLVTPVCVSSLCVRANMYVKYCVPSVCGMGKSLYTTLVPEAGTRHPITYLNTKLGHQKRPTTA